MLLHRLLLPWVVMFSEEVSMASDLVGNEKEDNDSEGLVNI